MIYAPGEAFYLTFVVKRFGVLTDADALPTANLMSGAAVVSAAVVAKTATGQYTVSGNLPAGAANGAKYWVRVLVTVDAVQEPLDMEVGTVRPLVRVPALGAFSDTDAADTLLAWLKAMMLVDAPSPTSLGTAWASSASSLEALAAGQMPQDMMDNIHYAANAVLSMVQENFTIGGVAQWQDYAFPVFTVETLANSPSGGLSSGQANTLTYIANMVGADVVIDVAADPTCYHLVSLVSGTATEIARKELRDINGAKINTESKIPRQLLEVAAP